MSPPLRPKTEYKGETDVNIHRRYCVTMMLIMGTIAVPSSAQASKPSSAEKAVVVIEIGTSDIHRVTLSKRAAERLGIKTKSVASAAEAGTAINLTIPYSALIYDKKGATWVYTNSKNLTFIRQSVTVEKIEREVAYLSKGPKAGTKIATVGVAELFGSELGVGGSGH